MLCLLYINNDLFGGSYRRDWEGDYHCSKAEIKAMLRDAAEETEDMKIVEQFDVSVLVTETLKSYRNHHKSYRPEHVFNNLPDEEYLLKIGAAAYDEDGRLRPTTAGLLMFGEEYHIVREFPEYFLDYREMLDPSIRWTDRLQSSSGDWSGNVFDFFFRVNSKITKDIKKPFMLDGIIRVDDTSVHRAVREALVNCLVNTDYFLPCGVVVKKDEHKIVFENPGSIRTGKKQMLHGGISDPRNKTLMKMFNMIGIGERAGSGIPDIYQVWENEGWKLPVVEERYNPDRTILLLEFVENEAKKASEESKRRKQSKAANDENKRINKAEKTSEENKRRKQAKKTSEENKRRKTEDNYKAIREYLRKNGLSKTNEIAEAIGLSSSRTRVILKEMPDVEYEGTNTNRKYRLKEQL